MHLQYICESHYYSVSLHSFPALIFSCCFVLYPFVLWCLNLCDQRKQRYNWSVCALQACLIKLCHYENITNQSRKCVMTQEETHEINLTWWCNSATNYVIPVKPHDSNQLTHTHILVPLSFHRCNTPLTLTVPSTLHNPNLKPFPSLKPQIRL